MYKNRRSEGPRLGGGLEKATGCWTPKGDGIHFGLSDALLPPQSHSKPVDAFCHHFLRFGKIPAKNSSKNKLPLHEQFSGPAPQMVPRGAQGAPRESSLCTTPRGRGCWCGCCMMAVARRCATCRLPYSESQKRTFVTRMQHEPILHNIL